MDKSKTKSGGDGSAKRSNPQQQQQQQKAAKQQNNQSSSKKGKGGGKSGSRGGSHANNREADDENKAKIPFQAVVLADSFTRTLRPITVEIPKVLVPLANVPMLEYTIEFLAASGVEEIILFCCWRANDVEKYIQNSRWANSTNPLVRTVSYRRVTNAGDAIRQLESLGIIKSDPFVLMSGDVIANVNLGPAIQAHKERREKDKECAMTMIFRENGGASLPRTATVEDDLVIALNPTTGQILRYENDTNQSTLVISQAKELFKTKGPNIEVRYDLCDCFIDICSPEVISQISDNYDYQDLRKDYIRLETQNHELGLKFFAHVFSSSNEYAARIHDIRTYDAVSKDVIHRWTYPRVPDTNWSSHPSTYTMTHGFVYREMGVSVSRSASIGESSIIGANTKLSSNVKIERSTIGRNCVIGEGVHISDSYIWDNVVIENGSKINKALICNNVHVHQNVIIERGAVLSFNVVIGEGVHIKPFARITTLEKSQKVEDEWSDNEDDDEEQNDDDNEDGDNDRMSDFDDNEDFEEDVGNQSPRAASSSISKPPSNLLICEPDTVGANGKGRKYHQDDEDSQFSVDSSEEYGGAPEWMHDAIDFYRNRHNPPIEEPYAILRSAMAAVEIEQARQQLWDSSKMKESKSLLGNSVSEKKAPDALTPSIIKPKSEFNAKRQNSAESAHSSSSPSKEDNDEEDDADALIKETDANNERFIKGLREFVESGSGGIEIISFRLSENRSNSDMIYALIPILFEKCQELPTATQIAKDIKALLVKNLLMIKSYVNDAQTEHALIESLELFCLYGQRAPYIALNPLVDRESEKVTTSQALRSAFPLVLSALFTDEIDLASADGLERWKSQHEDDDDLNQELFENNFTKNVLDTILDDDEDDEDEDDEEDEDE